jgi:hypothetical protein
VSIFLEGQMGLRFSTKNGGVFGYVDSEYIE